MNGIGKLKIAMAAAWCVVFAVPAPVYGQQIIHVYRNTASVRYLIKEVGSDSKDFRARYERRYRQIFLSDWRHSDDARKAMQKMDEALEKVNRRQIFGEKPKYFRDDVQIVIERARDFDRMFRNPDEVMSAMHGDWLTLRRNIDDLAASYDLPSIEE